MLGLATLWKNATDTSHPPPIGPLFKATSPKHMSVHWLTTARSRLSRDYGLCLPTLPFNLSQSAEQFSVAVILICLCPGGFGVVVGNPLPFNRNPLFKVVCVNDIQVLRVPHHQSSGGAKKRFHSSVKVQVKCWYDQWDRFTGSNHLPVHWQIPSLIGFSGSDGRQNRVWACWSLMTYPSKLWNVFLCRMRRMDVPFIVIEFW